MKFLCPECGNDYRSDDDLVAKRHRCGNCGTRLVLVAPPARVATARTRRINPLLWVLLLATILVVVLAVLVTAPRFGPSRNTPAASVGTRAFVTEITDGDTLKVMANGETLEVRLVGIDCPETDQFFGMNATAQTTRLAHAKWVTLRAEGRDRYGRTLAELALPDGKSLNKELVRTGYAWHYAAYSDSPELQRLQAEAKTAKRGLWAFPAPTPPWEHRGGRRSRQNKVETEEASDDVLKKLDGKAF